MNAIISEVLLVHNDASLTFSRSGATANILDLTIALRDI